MGHGAGGSSFERGRPAPGLSVGFCTMTTEAGGQGSEVVVSLDSLRPGQLWSTDTDDFVVSACDPEATTVQVT